MAFQLNITCPDLNLLVIYPFIPDSSKYSQLTWGQYDIEYNLYTFIEQAQMEHGSRICSGITLENLNW